MTHGNDSRATNQLALTRDQALALVAQLIDALARLLRLTESRAPKPSDPG
jgi:hypothetical protein